MEQGEEKQTWSQTGGTKLWDSEATKFSHTFVTISIKTHMFLFPLYLLSCNQKDKTKSTKAMEDLGGVDDGGNRASSIWLSVGGDKDFGQWMKNTCSNW